MIGIRTPFRISFSGGSTDLPSFYEKFEGKVISTTINKYMYHFIHKFDENLIQIKYSETETIDNPKKIKHKIVRALAEEFDLLGLDINSIADVPKGSGLGSSSSFTVGIINGLSLFNNITLSKRELAEKSCEIEIEKLKEPIGKQDQYAAAFGGLNKYTFKKDGSVEVENITLNEDARQFINSSLALIKVGNQRSAYEILSPQNEKFLKNDEDNISRALKIKDLVDPMCEALEKVDLKNIGQLLTENWNLKQNLDKKVTNKLINKLIEDLISNDGIYGAKLLGAGGSGYVLVCGEPLAIKNIEGLNKLNISLEKSGSTIIFQD